MKHDEKRQFQCTAFPNSINPKPHFSWRIQIGDKTKNMIGVDHFGETDDVNQLAGSIIQLSPDTVFHGYEGVHSDMAVECLVSHPELGDDLVAYTHLVEVLCKPFVNTQYLLSF